MSATELARMLQTLLAAEGPLIRLSCQGCAREVEVDEGPAKIAELIEHAQFEHGIRDGLELHRQTQLLSGYELAQMMKLPTLTEHEQKWREKVSS